MVTLPDVPYDIKTGCWGYPVFIDNDTYGKNYPVHRWVFETYKRKLRYGEVIHHINRDKQDYSSKNLDVFPNQAAHHQQHEEDYKKYGAWSYTGNAEDMGRFNWHPETGSTYSPSFGSSYSSSTSSRDGRYRRYSRSSNDDTLGQFIVWSIALLGLILATIYYVLKVLINVVGDFGWKITIWVERVATEFFEYAINSVEYWENHVRETWGKSDEEIVATWYGQLAKKASFHLFDKIEHAMILLENKVKEKLAKKGETVKAKERIQKEELEKIAADLSVVCAKISLFCTGLTLFLATPILQIIWLAVKCFLALANWFFKFLQVLYKILP